MCCLFVDSQCNSLYIGMMWQNLGAEYTKWALPFEFDEALR